MADMKKLPIGIEFFREFKSDNFYYVDDRLYRQSSTNKRKCESFYTAAAFWKKSEHGYAQIFFRGWDRPVTV